MWSSIWKWAGVNKLLAAIFVTICLVALASAGGFISARSAASRFSDMAKGWAEAYKRDTSATKKEYEARIRILTADRDSYRTKYEAARKKMAEPWVAPTNSRDLEQRFQALGYRGISR